MVSLVTMDRPTRTTLRRWLPGMDRDDDYKVDRQKAKVRFLLAHHECCLIEFAIAGTCKGHRFEDAGRSSNYQYGAAWESATDTLATIDQAINALGFRLRLGAQCLIQRGAGHIAADGKFTPNVFAIITWGALARKHRMRKQTLMDDAREAVEAMALLMLDWVKVELPT